MFIPQRVAEASQEVGKGLAFRSVTATGKKNQKTFSALCLPFIFPLSGSQHELSDSQWTAIVIFSTTNDYFAIFNYYACVHI